MECKSGVVISVSYRNSNVLRHLELASLSYLIEGLDGDVREPCRRVKRHRVASHKRVAWKFLILHILILTLLGCLGL